MKHLERFWLAPGSMVCPNLICIIHGALTREHHVFSLALYSHRHSAMALLDDLHQGRLVDPCHRYQHVRYRFPRRRGAVRDGLLGRADAVGVYCCHTHLN